MASAEKVGPKALVKGVQVLKLLADHPPGLNLATLAESTDMPKPTVHRLVAALAEAGLVRFDAPAGRYRIAHGVLPLASAFLEGVDIREVCLPVLRELAAECGETCHLGVRDGLQIVYIDKCEARWPVRMYSRIGTTNALYCTGLGKAVLAWSGDAVLEEVVASGPERKTAATIIGADELRAEMRRVRERGWAVDDVENELGIRCVGAPVFDWEMQVVGAMSIAGPEIRMTDDALDRFGPMVRDAGRRASEELGARM
ncbi:IclR family acetate operon transcriptional repressor [Lipingzhangella halophila]|uniref:IclR family acetate operon transcriptional repressor n=1 Tax=Lipingzhangella halophila TaxID=1783352 RepID=A0A7W7RNZ7_9ACTN|nr:IclR family transcriptional regulator [Lipingzhangella halophila]MBB4935494.1 IclR family acetate operon transcriptional repressor [Lipingzhangella halophila]